MPRSEEAFERYLREFRPRKPRPLPGRAPILLRHWVPRIAIAAMLVLIVAAMIFLSRERKHEAQLVQPPATAVVQPATRSVARAVSVQRLTMLAQTDPEQLDAALAEVSRKLLPHVELAGGALHGLDTE